MVGHGRVISGELRIIATDKATQRQLLREFSASWRLTGEKRVSGELRLPGDAAVVGHVAVSWRNLADSLGETPVIGGPIAASARLFQAFSGTSDPATGLGGIEIEIDEAVFGRSISCSARAETKTSQWIVRSAPGDWWERIAVFRAGVPIPVQFSGP